MRKEIAKKVKQLSESKMIAQLKENSQRSSYIIMAMILVIGILVVALLGYLL